ncbi:ABC transporter substrate-binding protein [Brucella tritici]|uniref:ABC transporter substrate-binding protein n=1 Tax=Brucella tritici TaxID=94626 RepID=A0A6L3YMU4_9HYPH|nr:ABC transporter substrate-binding protein [Brucella tritici]KAB2684188.1 ABC transporter substrate-binding protein [Brucella tritici]
MKRSLLSCSAIFTLMASATVTSFAAEIPITDAVKSSGKLTIANSLSYAPFEFTDASGNPAGLSIELAQAAADLMGVKLEVVTIPFASQIPALSTGRAMAAWTTFTVLPERLKQVDFVSFMETGSMAAVKPEDKDKFKKKLDLCGHAVAVQTGSSGDVAADKISAECEAASLSKLNKMIFPEQKDSTSAVLSGRAEAWLDDSTAVGYFEKTSKGQLVVTGESYYPSPLAIAVQKGDKATVAMVDALFKEMIANGTYKKLLDNYNMGKSSLENPVIYTDVSQLNQ